MTFASNVRMLVVAVIMSAVVCAAHEHDHRHDDLLNELHPSSDRKLHAHEEPAVHGKAHHVCIHDQIKMDPEKIPVAPQVYAQPKNSTREFVELAFSNIRVKAFWDVDGLGSCDSTGQAVTTYRSGGTAVCAASEVLTPIMKDYIMNVLVGQAMAIVSATLNVQPVSGNLVMPTDCNTITLPDAHRVGGVADADMVLYITAVPLATASTSQTVAWATTCARDGAGRPVAGHVNFVPSALGNAQIRNDVTSHNDIMTAVHEIAHALGFSGPFFSYGYLNNQGNRILDGSGVVTVSADVNLGKPLSKIATPRVLARARTFFDCQTLDGVEIEDQGGSGTQGSHWEKRILYQEFMAGILSTVKTYFSSLTLAFFEDTGFYTANYGAAEDSQMNWGRARGCPFVTTKCNSASVKDLGEFCFDENRKSRYCTFDRLGKGFCPVTEYSGALESSFQYFSSPAKGASVSLGDYCPAVAAFSNQICINSANADSQDIYGSTYSSGSRCFESNLIDSSYSASSGKEARCFTFSCESGRLIIGVKGQSAACPADGSAGNADTSTLRGYSGSIVCPAAIELCPAAGPTPAPTPAPPTPAPTAAPPGYTPAPGPTYRPSTPAPKLATTCSARITCANNLPQYMPFCRRQADALLSCFGTTCATEVAAWLSTRNMTCRDPTAYGLEKCVEGYIGGVALCALTAN